MPESFANKTMVITGGGSGIGAACARLFSHHGANIVIAGRREATLQAVASGNENIATHVTDVGQEEDVDALFDFTYQQFGRTDILINCAAIIDVVRFDAMPLVVWHNMINVNVTGSMLCSRAAFSHMKSSKKGGAIVNISSLGGIRSTQKFPGFTPYVASKFAVVGLTEALAVEGKEHNIRVNCVAPGAVKTDMLKKAAPFLKTSTTPEDVAKTILFLCDEEQSGKISGSTIEIHSNE